MRIFSAASLGGSSQIASIFDTNGKNNFPKLSLGAFGTHNKNSLSSLKKN